MDNLLKEVRQVQRRLAVQHFLGILGWCWFASLLAAAIAVGAARIWPVEDMIRIRDWHFLAGFLAVGLAVAVFWTLWTIAPALRAALEIDRRCGLKERVSSTLAMNEADRQSEAGQALIADASARLRRTAVIEKFPLRAPRNLLLPLVPAVVAVAAILLWSPAQKKVIASTETAAVQTPPEVKKTADDLREKLAERRKEAEKAGLPDATELLKKLEEATNELKKQTDHEKALVKLNDLARELQDRRKQLGGGSGESFKRQMEQIQGIDKGPADKLAKALAKGDFQKAADELQKLQKQLADQKLDPAKKDELAKQMEQLKQKLEDMAQQAKQAQAELQKQADQMRQAGDPNAAKKLEEQIQRLQQQAPQMDALKSLCDKLGQCSSQMKQGQGGQAAQSIQQALQQLQEMARQQSELKTLDAALQAIDDARQQCNGKECEGGQMMAMGDGEGDKNGKPGPNLGTGPGNGARPEAKGGDRSFYDSRVSATVGKGAGHITGMTDGPNMKGQAEAEILKAATEVDRGTTNPLSGQNLPKRQREHAQEYFDSFREGK